MMLVDAIALLGVPVGSTGLGLLMLRTRRLLVILIAAVIVAAVWSFYLPRIWRMATAYQSLPVPGREAVHLEGLALEREPVATAVVASASLALDYGGETWPSLSAMPPEVQAYYVTTVADVASFFNVRPGDIAGILRAEQNNTGWTLEEPGVSSAGATGVAQVVARTWNGWSNPHTSSHSRSLAEIERYGGIGFDWFARGDWLKWRQGIAPLSSLEETNADPRIFENGVSAIARHLARWGLTRDAYEKDPEAFLARLADAVAVYNSGKPLSVSRNFTQSAANRKTVGEYVEEVMATSEAWDVETAVLGLPFGGQVQGSPVLARPLPPEPEPTPALPQRPVDPAGRLVFTAYPLDPMPKVVKPFGAPVNYQAGGRHTGIDVAGRDGATLYAVADSTVTYVGPLFCDQPRACRGDNAVVLEVGPNAYAIYSHNSAALVEPGDRVAAGQPVGKQGNEGYSFGSHLHFEVHVGAPWSGDWRKPFNGGEFVDPMSYFPN